jgi:hypothetical protein
MSGFGVVKQEGSLSASWILHVTSSSGILGSKSDMGDCILAVTVQYRRV